jgi:hypothetical protein
MIHNSIGIQVNYKNPKIIQSNKIHTTKQAKLTTIKILKTHKI